jgi:glucose/arabinose dehydrogenase
LTLVGSINFDFPTTWEHTTYALAVRDTPDQSGDYDVFFNIGSRVNSATSVDAVTASGLISASLNADSIYKFTVHDAGGTSSYSNLTLVATGLRNSAGIAIQPSTGDLYFEDNGIDGLAPNEPLSADELNRIAAADIGKIVPDFGFAHDYIQYRTGVRVGSGAVQPLVAFQPIPDPLTGSESEGPSEIAFTPTLFQLGGLNPGVFVGFHGKFNQGGIANEENPLVYYDLTTGESYHFIGNDEPDIGHLDGLLATADSLFVADLSFTGGVFSPGDAGKGVIYQIKVVPEPTSLALVSLGLLAATLRLGSPLVPTGQMSKRSE